jgi:hypothetical protein
LVFEFKNFPAKKKTNISKIIAKTYIIAIFETKPTNKNAKQEDIATQIAYGSCVEVCSIWLHSALAEESMVLSEIGEQWSPKIEPESTAETVKTIISGAAFWHAAEATGISIPNAPHEDPIANESIAEPINTTNGRNFSGKLDEEIILLI